MSTYLAYLTRLRQAVGHIFLLEGVLQENFNLEDFNYIRRQLSIMGGKTPMHSQLQQWVKMEYDGFETRGGDSKVFGRGQFGYAFDMDTELREMEATKSIEEVVCRICSDVLVDPKITEVSTLTRLRPVWNYHS
jgi:hypothetical protein